MEEFLTIENRVHQAYLWSRLHERLSDLVGSTNLPTWTDVSKPYYLNIIRKLVRRRIPTKAFIDSFYNDVTYLKAAYSENVGEQRLKDFFTANLRSEFRLDLNAYITNIECDGSKDKPSSPDVLETKSVKTRRRRKKKDVVAPMIASEHEPAITESLANEHAEHTPDESLNVDFIKPVEYDMAHVDAVEHQEELISPEMVTQSEVTVLNDSISLKQHTFSVIEKNDAINSELADEFVTEPFAKRKAQSGTVKKHLKRANVSKPHTGYELSKKQIVTTSATRRSFLGIFGIRGRKARQFIDGDIDYYLLRWLKDLIYRITRWPCQLIKNLVFTISGLVVSYYDSKFKND